MITPMTPLHRSPPASPPQIRIASISASACDAQNVSQNGAQNGAQHDAQNGAQNSPSIAAISAGGAEMASWRLAMMMLHSAVIGTISNGCSTWTPTSSMPTKMYTINETQMAIEIGDIAPDEGGN